ncbi:hypothetical protein CRE_24519 [Caenorhabditis remanei]|uniref:Uncharacterized protein n=1 Tax=Caenorhabditis remanei TaxID=31234 RepID=E3MG25_CAERE|nr:hypothetical protein CRE_24519 [Caenorhabditis remanei]
MNTYTIEAKTGASESGTEPEEVESLGITLVQSHVPIIDKKKGIIADLFRILTDYTVSHELNGMERSFEEFTLQEEENEVSPPRITISCPHVISPPPSNTNDFYEYGRNIQSRSLHANSAKADILSLPAQ